MIVNRLLLISFSLIWSCQCCSIFPSLNCSCFQSNSTIEIYSHLYCQGHSLTRDTFQSPFGSDYLHQNQFRTVSIEFSNNSELEIHSNQFDSLSMLFSKTHSQYPIELSLRFTEFDHISFASNSLTSKIFQENHPDRRLSLHLIPRRKNLTQIELDNENFTEIENTFHFSPNCFSSLKLSQMNVYIHTIRDRFPSNYTFEQIFNNTNIAQLNFHGAIIRPQLNSSKFFGQIRLLKLVRHVDTIDSYTYPYYPHVYSYTIHSIEAHSMNLTSFLFSHRNLRGLEIIKPRFDLSIDQFLPTLDSLTLDIEYLNTKTLLIARHIHNLKLGSQLRRMDRDVFQYLSRRLHHLDLSEIDFSQMTSDSRCYLLEYLSKHSQDHLNILYPPMKSSNECHCPGLFLESIQWKYRNHSSCSAICQLSDCSIISQYFQKNYPLIQHEQINNDEKKNSDEYVPPIEIFSDPVDIDMANFLINQTSDEEKNQTQRFVLHQSTTQTIATLENLQEYDDILFTSTLFNEENPDTKSISFSWLSFAIGVGVVLLLLVLLSLIVLFVIKYRKDHDFKPVPVYV